MIFTKIDLIFSAGLHPHQCLGCSPPWSPPLPLFSLGHAPRQGGVFRFKRCTELRDMAQRQRLVKQAWKVPPSSQDQGCLNPKGWCFLEAPQTSSMKAPRKEDHNIYTLEPEPSKTRPFLIKTRVIWVPGVFMPPKN